MIPNSVTTIGNYAFDYCRNLTAVTIPNNVTTIGDYAFVNCDGLTAVAIGNSVTTIRSHAFYGCDGLTAVTIPNNVTTIGNYAFLCTNLKEVTVEWITPLAVPDQLFFSVNTSTVTLHVPTGTIERYQNATVWKDFAIVEYDLTGNENIHPSTLTASASNGILYINGLQPGKPLHIYNITGQLVYKGVAKATQESIAVAARGIYVVTAGTQTVKIITK